MAPAREVVSGVDRGIRTVEDIKWEDRSQLNVVRRVGNQITTVDENKHN